MRLIRVRRASLGLVLGAACALILTTTPLRFVGESAAADNPQLPIVNLVPVASGLSSPVFLTHAGDGSGRAFIVEQAGRVLVLKDGKVEATPYLDIRSRVGCCGERGLLGLAFHPEFKSNGRVIASYTDKSGTSVLESFVAADPAGGRPDPASGRIILTQSQPFSNHNGGQIAFGPDGYLYYGLGDGGSGGDPLNAGQNPNTLLGKMLRIDVDVPSGYRIPADNPFANGGGRAEIWALGLRNPWRWSFDRVTGDLYVADVGQGKWEEVNFQPAASKGGENYGWNEWEGNHEFKNGAKREGKTFPIVEYGHTGGACSVTGGYVYHGTGILGLLKPYVYGDYCNGKIWIATNVGGAWQTFLLVDTKFLIPSFGEDEAGRLYVLNHQGSIHEIVSV